jgi:hypothetical protein
LRNSHQLRFSVDRLVQEHGDSTCDLQVTGGRDDDDGDGSELSVSALRFQELPPLMAGIMRSSTMACGCG